jgi:hypothetical protein
LTNRVELSRSSLSWFNHSNCEVSVFILSYFKSNLLHNIFESLGNQQVLLTWGVSAELLLRGPRWQPLWKRRSPYNPGPTIGQSRGSAVVKAEAKIWVDKVEHAWKRYRTIIYAIQQQILKSMLAVTTLKDTIIFFNIKIFYSRVSPEMSIDFEIRVKLRTHTTVDKNAIC